MATSTPLLGTFLVVCTAEVATAWLLWKRPRVGARVSHALLPAELVFWTGFALPFGPILGLARTLSILSARRNGRVTARPRASPAPAPTQAR